MGKSKNVFLGLAIITSILSFSVNSSISGICKYAMYLFWAIVAYMLLKDGNLKTNEYIKKIAFTWAFWFISAKVFCFFDFYPSSGAGVASFLLFCSVFYFIGYNWELNGKTTIFLIAIACLIGQIILMFTQFATLSDNTEYYLNGEKNQMGQMIGIGIILEVFILPYFLKKTVLRVACYIIGAVSLYTLMAIHSRTPLIAISIAAVLYFYNKKKVKRDYIIAIVIVIVLILTINYMGGVNYLIELFELEDTSISSIGSYDGINGLLSGRLDNYKIALNDFIHSPLIGVGAYAYIDNFVFNVLRTGGLVSAFMLFPIAYGTIRRCSKNSKEFLQREDEQPQEKVLLFTILRYLSIFYFVVSLFEGYPPFGPGASTFFFWLIIGMGDKAVEDEKILIDSGGKNA